MPQMSGTYATPRLDLGQAFYEYALDNVQYIGTRALPIFATPKQAASFTKLTRASIVRGRNVKRAKRANYRRDEFDIKDDSFTCAEFGTEQLLDDTERDLYASDIDAERASMEIAMHTVLREQEKRIAALLFNTTTWTGSSLYTDNSSAAWSNAATDVVAQVLAAIEKVRALVGMRPNSLIIGPTSLSNLLKNNDIKARLSGVQVVSSQAIQQYLAPIFGVQQILVSDSVQNTASEGKTEVMADIWSATYAMVAVTAKTNALNEPCLGRTFLWTADSPSNTTVEQYRDEQARSTAFRVRQNVQEKVFDASFAHLMKIG